MPEEEFSSRGYRLFVSGERILQFPSGLGGVGEPGRRPFRLRGVLGLARRARFVDEAGDGSLFDAYRYMMDAAGMDFFVVTDHQSGDQEYTWWRIEKSAVADLLDRVNDATHVRQQPLLGVVVLKWPGNHIEVKLRDLVRVAFDIVVRRPVAGLLGSRPPALAGPRIR